MIFDFVFSYFPDESEKAQSRPSAGDKVIKTYLTGFT